SSATLVGWRSSAVTRRSAVREFEFDSPVLGVGGAGVALVEHHAGTTGGTPGGDPSTAGQSVRAARPAGQG
ncbi:hypothetical protein, partial [Stutzerimonas nitrititolerans]|uniref:hypothetical protein n=1 Tax=Stutzerimonas nitrititolerans TaxID=2482751 RepID=UPI0028AB8E60